MAAPAARFRGRRGSPAQGGADAPGSARTARRWRGRSYCFAANALDRPVRVAAMARWHVLGHGGVVMVPAGAQMSGNPLALQKDLDGAWGQPHLDFATGKAIRDAVEVTFELDMVVNADPTEAPLGKAIGLGRQCIEVGPVQLFEQPPAGDAEPADPALVIELAQ